MFIVLDYVFAIFVAGAYGELNSRVGFKGIAKKVAILVLVAVAHHVDLVIGDKSLIRDTVIFFYIANEILSILETAAMTNLYIPDLLMREVDSVTVIYKV